MNNELSNPDSSIAQAPKTKRSLLSMVFLCLLFVLVLLTAAASAYLWQQLQHVSSDLVKNSVYQLEAQSAQQKVLDQQKELDTLSERLTESQTVLNELGVQQNQVAISLAKISGTNRNDWLLDELQHLTRLAHQRLVLSQDALGAIALLQAADQVVIEMRDASTLELRSAISEDIIKLKVVSNNDLEGAYILLSSLSKKIENLSAKQPSFPDSEHYSEQKKDEVSDDASKSRVTKALDNILEKIQPYLFRAFTIEGEVRPLLDKDDKKYLIQNINLLIAQAQLALLRREPKSYRLSIEQSQSWLRSYFDVNEPMVNTILGILEDLKAYQLNPSMPEINLTLDAVNDLVERYQNKKITQKKVQASEAQELKE